MVRSDTLTRCLPPYRFQASRYSAIATLRVFDRDAYVLGMANSQLLQLGRQAVAQRTFRPQFFEQLFRSLECGHFNLAAREHAAPAARDLFLG